MRGAKMKTVSSKKIEAVIFDLGQVIVKVDHQETFKPLTQILKIDQDAVMKLFKSEAYFLFELGKISEDQFFSQIHKAIPAPLMATIKEAWDAMIVDIPLDGISALRKLQNKIPLFALSNTNTSHLIICTIRMN
jgi:FMN phosphatase YigB (HAD superfamily)